MVSLGDHGRHELVGNVAREHHGRMTFITTMLVSGFSFLPGQAQIAEAAEFTKEQQVTATLATVRVRNTSVDREGSGVLIGKRGEYVFILTAQHIVQGGDRFEVAVYAKESSRPHKIYPSAEILAQMQGLGDLALLRLRTDDSMPSYLQVCPVAKVPKEMPISMLTAGCESGKAPTVIVEKGVEKKLAQRREGDEKATFWEVAAKYPPGRSGGPLIDKQAYLLGVCSGTNRDKTYFTHIDEIHRFLIRHGYRWLTEEKAEK
jgi:S1-C subfamily serine protease